MKTCPHCAGHCFDLDDRDWTPMPCPVCRGCGRVPGPSAELVSTASHIGRALFQAALVTALLTLVGAPAGVAAVAAVVAALATH